MPSIKNNNIKFDNLVFNSILEKLKIIDGINSIGISKLNTL